MKTLNFLAAAALLVAPACQVAEYDSVYAVHGTYTLADSYDVDTESGGVTTTSSPEYTSLQGGVLNRYEEADGTPVFASDLVIADSEFENAGALEIAGGFRWYMMANPTVKPWVGVYTIYTVFGEAPGGVEPGGQLGVAPAAGLEWELTERFFLELQVDYNVPVITAESDQLPTFDTEASGMAVRFGIGLDF